MNSQTVEGADHLLRHQSHLCLSTKEVSEIAAQLQSSNEERSGSLQRLSSILDDIRAKTMKRQQEQTVRQ